MSGPYYANLTDGTFPTQNGAPVLITESEFNACCCDGGGPSDVEIVCGMPEIVTVTLSGLTTCPSPSNFIEQLTPYSTVQLTGRNLSLLSAFDLTFAGEKSTDCIWTGIAGTWSATAVVEHTGGSCWTQDVIPYSGDIEATLTKTSLVLLCNQTLWRPPTDPGCSTPLFQYDFLGYVFRWDWDQLGPVIPDTTIVSNQLSGCDLLPAYANGQAQICNMATGGVASISW